MNTFIIASHSIFAQGVYECLKFFKSDINNVHYLNAYVEDMEFEKSLRKLLESIEAENLIVLTDLPGGSVNIVCNNLMKEYSYHLISGINLPLALELIFQVNVIEESTIRELIKTSQNQIVYMNEIVDSVEEESEEL